MKVPNLNGYALGMCAGIAILAGCNAAGSALTPLSSVPQNAPRTTEWYGGSANADTSPLKGEVLTASDVTVRLRDKDFKFVASGGAKGKYRGTFVAKGSWSFSLDADHWGFQESFTIRSGGRAISGTISGGGNGIGPIKGPTFGPVSTRGVLKYTYRSWSGPVTTNKIKRRSLRESLL